MRHAVRHLFSVLLERRAKRRDSTLGAVRFCGRVQNGAGWVSEDRVSDRVGLLARPGGDPLSHPLGGSTLGAAEFHGRVRNGAGWGLRAVTTRSSQESGRPGRAAGRVGACASRRKPEPAAHPLPAAARRGTGARAAISREAFRAWGFPEDREQRTDDSPFCPLLLGISVLWEAPARIGLK